MTFYEINSNALMMNKINKLSKEEMKMLPGGKTKRPGMMTYSNVTLKSKKDQGLRK